MTAWTLFDKSLNSTFDLVDGILPILLNILHTKIIRQCIKAKLKNSSAASNGSIRS